MYGNGARAEGLSRAGVKAVLNVKYPPTLSPPGAGTHIVDVHGGGGIQFALYAEIPLHGVRVLEYADRRTIALG